MADPPRQAALRAVGTPRSANPRSRPTMKSTARLRPALETLEARDVLAPWTGGSLTSLLSPAKVPAPTTATAQVAYVAAAFSSPTIVSSQSLADRVAAFAASRLGQRVGGGECVHLAAEALRVAGARFAWLGGTTSDYAWGGLITQVTGYATGAVYSKLAPIRPGDIIQYAGAMFRDGTWGRHHTAIVASVDQAGRVTAVYQQNFNGVRAVTRQPLDLSQLI